MVNNNVSDSLSGLRRIKINGVYIFDSKAKTISLNTNKVKFIIIDGEPYYNTDYKKTEENLL